MIEVRVLNEADSEACIQFKKHRMMVFDAGLFEERKNSFFALYKLYSDESWTYGAFNKGELVGICTLIKIPDLINTFLITDLVVAANEEFRFVPVELFHKIWSERLSTLNPLRIAAVEQFYKKLEPLKVLVKKFNLVPLEDDVIYTAVINIKNVESPLAHTALKPKAIPDAILAVDPEAVDIDGVVAFTDSRYRQFSFKGNVIRRLNLLSSHFQSLNDPIIQQAAFLAGKRNLSYIAFSSSEKFTGFHATVYTNRILKFCSPGTGNFDVSNRLGIII